jgi:hypothetical protein
MIDGHPFGKVLICHASVAIAWEFLALQQCARVMLFFRAAAVRRER